jgi:hypothetical protein
VENSTSEAPSLTKALKRRAKFVFGNLHVDVEEAMQAAGCAYDFPSELDRRFFAATTVPPHCQLTSGASSFKRV